MNVSQRRCQIFKKCWDTYIFIVFLATVFHIVIFAGDFPEGLRYINMTIGITYLLVIYLGYKFGRWLGLLGGIISSFSWFLYALISNYEVSYNTLFIKGAMSLNNDFILGSFSINHIVLYAFLGYLSGFLFDKLENFLDQRDLTLIELLPFSNNLFIDNVATWVSNLSKALYLSQLNPEDKKGTILRRLRKLFVIIITIPLIILFNILSQNIETVAHIQNIDIYIGVPTYVAPILILWFSYVYSFKVGIWLSLSLIFSEAIGLIFRNQYNIDIHFSSIVNSPTVIIALVGLSWFIGVLFAQLKDNELLNKIFPEKKKNDTENFLSVRHIILMILLLFSISYSNEYIKFQYFTIGSLSIYIIYLSLYYNANNVSNTILLISGIMSFFAIIFNFDNNIKIYFGRFDMVEVVILALIPQALRYFNLKTLNNLKLFIMMVFLLLWIKSVIFSSLNIEPHIFFTLDFYKDQEKYSYIYSDLYLLSVLSVYLLIEIGSRIIWFKSETHNKILERNI